MNDGENINGNVGEGATALASLTPSTVQSPSLKMRQVCITLTPAEYAEVELEAMSRGIKVNAFARLAVWRQTPSLQKNREVGRYKVGDEVHVELADTEAVERSQRLNGVDAARRREIIEYYHALKEVKAQQRFEERLRYARRKAEEKLKEEKRYGKTTN